MSDSKPTSPIHRAAWLTDIHLNFVDGPRMYEFFASIAREEPDAVFITGDIAESRDFALCLDEMQETLELPVFFVLGNHDFYRSSLAAVRKKAAALAEANSSLIWLPHARVAQLTPATALVGHEGWADGRLGDYAGSDVVLNDYVIIQEFMRLNKRDRLQLLNRLGDEAAAHFQNVLPAALERYQHVILLTHVPPFRGSCWYDGHISDDNWLPHMSCKAVGETLLSIMQKHPDRDLTVLCGHTHGAGDFQPLPNLRVLTAAAAYGAPAIAKIIDVT